MSGGFFRGTTADQDTRFSNKQAKLLKSQKFPPELDHLVDITKVKMDVIRPWIATRATELLGFEDEVLINFVYGLLDGKEVDGKQIQIQLTGFMEKNTGKFMKELWSLLLSAQTNASGVPQQFLDAKEEEMIKKKAETDRITQEIQKRREKDQRESEREKQRRNDDEADISRSANVARESGSKRSGPRVSSIQSGEEQKMDIRHGRGTKNRYSKSPRSSESPHSNKHSPSSRRDSPLATRSSSKSFSKSRSYSEEKHKSRSKSVSSQSQRRSSSPERQHRSPTRRSISPVRRYRSPPRRSISPRRRYSPWNNRSPPRRRQRSPSPTRWRSPHSRRRSPFARRRSPSPIRRRSPSPPRRRSPIRRRSPSPSHRRSPIRPRSPSPLRRRSPLRRSPRHRRWSPVHSARNRATDYKVSPRRRKSPYKSRSPPYRTRRSLSAERDTRANGVESKRYRNENASQRMHEKRSPLHGHDRQAAEHPGLRSKVSDSVSHRLPISLRSPQRDSRDQHDVRNRLPIVPREKSPKQSESRKTLPRKDRRSPSMSESPVKQTKEHMSHYDSPETAKNEEENIFSREDASRTLVSKTKDLPADKGRKKFHARDFSPESYSPGRSADNQSPRSQGHPIRIETRKVSEERKDIDFTERHVRGVSPLPDGVQYGPGRARRSLSPDDVHDKQSTKTRDASSSEERGQATKQSSLDRHRVNSEKRSHSKSEEYREPHHKIETVANLKRKADWNDSDAISSESGEIETYRPQNLDKRRHKKSDRQRKDLDDGSESESQKDDRKEAKRRRKDEKRLRKEEKRRRREEKHRKKLERRANKQKLKPMDTVAPPSDTENNLSDESDGDAAMWKNSHPNEAEAESEQKKLEFELRKKALESLKAKRAISH